MCDLCRVSESNDKGHMPYSLEFRVRNNTFVLWDLDLTSYREADATTQRKVIEYILEYAKVNKFKFTSEFVREPMESYIREWCMAQGHALKVTDGVVEKSDPRAYIDVKIEF